MLVSKKRYNVNKRITRFIFAGHLCNKRIQNSSYYFIKVGFSSKKKKKKRFSCLYEKYVFSPVLFFGMIFAEITFCPSIKLEQPVMVLVLFSYVSAKLRNALHGFIRTTEFTGFKRESRVAFCTAHFCTFFLINVSLNIMYLVCICMCYVF